MDTYFSDGAKESASEVPLVTKTETVGAKGVDPVKKVVIPPIAKNDTMIDWKADLVKKAVKEYFVKYANDPSSVTFVEYREPMPFNGPSWSLVKCDTALYVTIRQKNTFGALSIDYYLVYLKDLSVVDSKARSSSDRMVFDLYLFNIYRTKFNNPMNDFAKGMADGFKKNHPNGFP